MNLNKDPESWSKVSPLAVSEASQANIFNVLAMALDDIAKMAIEIETLRADRDRTARNRDMWKGQCDRQADQLRKRSPKSDWSFQDDLVALSKAIDHTLSVHGHMDANTPLHNRLQRTLAVTSGLLGSK